MPTTWLDSRAPHFQQTLSQLLASRRAVQTDVARQALAIVDRVRSGGDQALLACEREFSEPRPNEPSAKPSANIEDFRIDPGVCKAAWQALAVADQTALRLAHDRIRDFHIQATPTDLHTTDASGTHLSLLWKPVDSALLYVPGGTAAYPSSVLMNALPAQVAGVKRISLTTPGAKNTWVLAAAHLTEVTEAWRFGGAQAIAAFAYGTESLEAVNKITGPGNAWVAEAKHIVSGDVGIDSIAGPSEILILSDGNNQPDWLAFDLLSQAEHDEDAMAILITTSEDEAHAVLAAIDQALTHLSRGAIAGESWRRRGAVIVVPTLAAAPDLINHIAPEHLVLSFETAEARKFLTHVRHAGAVFIGRHTPEAIGDYVAGPNHVLPTSGTARFSSGLCVHDFLKRMTVAECDPSALQAIGPAAVRLAEAEGLTAHAQSVRIRLAQA